MTLNRFSISNEKNNTLFIVPNCGENRCQQQPKLSTVEQSANHLSMKILLLFDESQFDQFWTDQDHRGRKSLPSFRKKIKSSWPPVRTGLGSVVLMLGRIFLNEAKWSILLRWRKDIFGLSISCKNFDATFFFKKTFFFSNATFQLLWQVRNNEWVEHRFLRSSPQKSPIFICLRCRTMLALFWTWGFAIQIYESSFYWWIITIKMF